MNKLTKGAITGAAGIALLLGGAGSFALWNGSASAAAGSIQAGAMTIAPDAAAGTWTVSHGGAAIPVANIATFHAVPGDTLTLTQKVDITATGDNLTSTLSVDPTTIVPSTTVNPAASTALAAALTKNMTVAIPVLPAGITAGTANTYTVAGTTGTQVVTVVVTLPFDATTTGTTAQSGLVSLSALAFKLQQN